MSHCTGLSLACFFECALFDVRTAASVVGDMMESNKSRISAVQPSTISRSTLWHMGLINKVDLVCLSPVGYGVWLTFRALALRRSRTNRNVS